MNNKLSLLVVLLFTSILVLAGCGDKKPADQPKAASTQSASEQKSSDKPIIIKLATNHPATHVATIAGSKYFMDRVEKETNGKVKFEFYPAQQLGKAKDMLNLVKSGTADMTYTLSSLVPGELPLSTVGELPVFDDARIAVKAFRKLADEDLYEKEIKRHGIRPLIVVVWSQCVMFSSKEIKTLEELQGLKIGTSGNVKLGIAKALGGVPVLMSAADTYEMMQRGVVDTTTAMFNNAESYKLNEIVKNAVTKVPMGGYLGYYFINENTWQKLPEDVKQVMIKVGLDASDNLSKVSEEEDKRVELKWEKEGMKVNRLDGTEREKWLAKISTYEEEWIKEMEAKGLDARPVLDKFKQYLKEETAKK